MGLVFLANFYLKWENPIEKKENMNVAMTPKAKPRSEVECQLWIVRWVLFEDEVAVNVVGEAHVVHGH